MLYFREARKIAPHILPTIETIYLDGIALNARMVAKAGQALSIYGVDGRLAIEDATIAPMN